MSETCVTCLVGRPGGVDRASTAASGACPPAFKPDDKTTFTKKKGELIPVCEKRGITGRRGGM